MEDLVSLDVIYLPRFTFGLNIKIDYLIAIHNYFHSRGNMNVLFKIHKLSKIDSSELMKGLYYL